jgi:hypothetical protein
MRRLHAAFRVAILLPILVVGSVYTVSAARAHHPAQDQPADSLESQLGSQYKVTRLGSDSSGTSVVEQGTILAIQKGGILGVPPTNVAIGVSTYKDGQMHSPGFGQMVFLGQVTRLLQVGEKVYVLKVAVDLKNDRVALAIMECDSCNGLNQYSSYRATVAFQYPKGYLGSAEPDQVEDVISQVLTIDTGSPDQQQAQDSQAPAAAQEPPPSAAPPQPPPTIQIGESISDVTTAIGQPKKIVDLGAKKIYVYDDLKITFMNGKVSNVE